jgi:hypothetical protein
VVIEKNFFNLVNLHLKMSEYNSIEKTWILSKYAKLMLKKTNDPSSSYWKTIDCNQCDKPIYISVKATNYLQINYDNEYLVCTKIAYNGEFFLHDFNRFLHLIE